jgi:hypothetical protein
MSENIIILAACRCAGCLLARPGGYNNRAQAVANPKVRQIYPHSVGSSDSYGECLNGLFEVCFSASSWIDRTNVTDD